MNNIETKDTTIVFVDIVDYTTITNLLSRDSFAAFHDAFDGIVKQSCEAFDGKAIKKIGDSYLLTFDEPTNALYSSMLMQELFSKHNEGLDKQTQLKIRVGIHYGIVLVRDGDIYGTSVNVASRIESIGRSSEILFSEQVQKQINALEIPHIEIGPQKLKGLDEPIRVFKVSTHNEEMAETQTQLPVL